MRLMFWRMFLLKAPLHTTQASSASGAGPCATTLWDGRVLPVRNCLMFSWAATTPAEVFACFWGSASAGIRAPSFWRRWRSEACFKQCFTKPYGISAAVALGLHEKVLWSWRLPAVACARRGLSPSCTAWWIWHWRRASGFLVKTRDSS